jgi:hypothetical protein
MKGFQEKMLKIGRTEHEKRFFLYITVLNAADIEGENGRLDGPPYAF